MGLYISSMAPKAATSFQQLSIHAVKISISNITDRTVFAAILMPPAVASPAVDYLPIVVIFLRAPQAQIPLDVVLRLGLPLLPVHAVPRPIPFDLVIQVLVKFTKFFDAITDTVIQIFIAFWLLVTLAVYF